jgi:rhamnose utilization protein RhaD (predicted bifunctional aldolase and dehydrogenase)/NAD(P)-dependent dehydrogenase (short-subunit alcohol dehydrogenase family)
MKNLWNDDEAQSFGSDALQQRVYSSRLLGRESALVMHGGGNTSVKDTITNLFDEQVEVLYVKGSGWDLASIEAEGFSPVKMEILLKLAHIESLSDSVIVREQRAALSNPSAPNPSVEAILHAIIPFKFVDHTHTDALVTLTNTPDGESIIRQIYGQRVMIVPYVMPGFQLARKVYEMTQGIDWSSLDGIVLMNHGLFTFANTARAAYDMMIELVTLAEDYLKQRGAFDSLASAAPADIDLLALSRIRKAVSAAAGKAMIALVNVSQRACGFARLPDVASIAGRGPITPDHVIRTKRIPMHIQNDVDAALEAYQDAYRDYFARHSTDAHTMLDPAPRWAIWQDVGIISFGESLKATRIAADITEHTIETIQWAEHFSTWHPLGEAEIFAVEYWELEQAKLKGGAAAPSFQGKVALVTGAVSGIGLACARALKEQGAVVMGLDINPDIVETMDAQGLLGLVCDLTDEAATRRAVEDTIRHYGGLDVLVSNAGIFPSSHRIEEMDAALWDKSLAINLTSHQRLLQACIPYLKNGIDPAVVIVGSRNFSAPGPGASAYSVAKAGVTQLARVAALELASFGIRVNVVHPDAVFDTGIWTDEVIEKRASSYGLTPDQYMTKNLLGARILSADVAALVCAMAGPIFSKTTGAQVPIDGGSDRVI